MRIPAEMDEFKDYVAWSVSVHHMSNKSTYRFVDRNQGVDLEMETWCDHSYIFISGRDRGTFDSTIFQTGLLKFRTMMENIFFNHYYSICRPKYAVKSCMLLRLKFFTVIRLFIFPCPLSIQAPTTSNSKAVSENWRFLSGCFFCHLPSSRSNQALHQSCGTRRVVHPEKSVILLRRISPLRLVVWALHHYIVIGTRKSVAQNSRNTIWRSMTGSADVFIERQINWDYLFVSVEDSDFVAR